VADAYIAVEVETDAVMLADAAIDRLKARRATSRTTATSRS
jgi:hypothetical protein